MPQRDALRTAFGLSAGPPPDRFLVGLAVLSLLSEVAGERPLICLVDDEQWLDHASAQALGFVARRLAADPVGLVFAAREPGAELAGLPELEVGGLGDDDARALLDSALAGPLDDRVRDLIVAETQGNPLALLELPRGLTPAELAGGFGLPGAAPLPGRIEESFRRQLEALPDQTRRLLLLAAAEPSGDPVAGMAGGRAAGHPGSGGGAGGGGGPGGVRRPGAVPASAAALGGLPGGVGRGPAGSARRAGRGHRPGRPIRTAGPGTGPRPRPGPDEEVAAELERSAGRAQARGGLAAAAAFLERSVLLTVDPARRAERTLAAAQASLQAGAFGKALELLAAAEAAGPLDELQSARADLLRGQIAFASGLGSDAPPLLLKAAKRLEPLDLDLARETYLTALDGGAVRRASGGRRRSAGGLPRRPGPAPPPRPAAAGRPAAGRPGPAGHRRAGRRGAGVAAGRKRLRRRGHHRGRRPPVGLAGPGGRQRPVGRRRLARDARPAGPARP